LGVEAPFKRKAAKAQGEPRDYLIPNSIRRAYQLIKIIYLSPVSNRGIQYGLDTEIVGFVSVRKARLSDRFAERNDR